MSSTACEPVTVEVGLDPVLHLRLGPADPGLRHCRDSLQAGLSRLMDELGLPIEPVVDVQAGEVTGLGPDEGSPIEVSLGGSASLSAGRIASQSWYWASAAGLPAGVGADLAETLRGLADARDAGRIGATLAVIVTEAARAEAVSLLTPPVIARWAADAGLPAGWDPGTVLHELVSLGLAPGKGTEIAGAIAGATGRPLDRDITGLEALIAWRASGPWEVRVHHESLRLLTEDARANSDRFRQLRKLLSVDKGLQLPRITLEEDASIVPGQASFRLFGVTSPVIVDFGSAPETRGPGSGVSAGPGSPVTLIASALYQLGLDRRGALITTATMATDLSRLSPSHPRLAALVASAGLETVTRLCRSLAVEGAHAGNVLPILQASLDVRERSDSALSDEELLREVRAQVSGMIAWVAARGAGRLTVWRVPEALEQLDSAAAARGLLRLAHRAASETTPGQVLVTTRQARPAIRAAIAARYPDLPVVSEDELADPRIVTASHEGPA